MFNKGSDRVNDLSCPFSQLSILTVLPCTADLHGSTVENQPLWNRVTEQLN